MLATFCGVVGSRCALVGSATRTAKVDDIQTTTGPKPFLHPLKLLIVDEADRLKTTSLKQLRHLFDRGQFGLVLIGMPGIEKRLARYPQLYSRIGFVHHYRPLPATELKQILLRHLPELVELPPSQGLDAPDIVAAILRITGGNLRLTVRLLTQIARVLEINEPKPCRSTSSKRRERSS